MKIGLEQLSLRDVPQIGQSRALERVGPGADPTGGARESGRNMFVELLDDALRADKVAEAQTTDYALGRTQDLHSTMATVAMADIKVQLLVNVRNKLIEAYRDVMRMS